MGGKVVVTDRSEDSNTLRQIVQKSRDLAKKRQVGYAGEAAKLVTDVTKRVKRMTDDLHKVDEGLKADRKTLDKRTKTIKALLKK